MPISTYHSVKEKFAEYGVNHVRNFGHRSTSQVEFIQGELKASCGNKHIELLVLYRITFASMVACRNRYLSRLREDCDNRRAKDKVVFDFLHCNIGLKALDEVE